MVGDSHAISALYEAVDEVFGDGSASIRDGGVVKVAAEDDALTLVFLDVVGYHFLC